MMIVLKFDKAGDAMRLQRFLAQAGSSSRRKAEELIAAGRVAVNEQPAALGQTIDPDQDIVTLDGQPVVQAPFEYYLLYKPPGFITTTRDERGRPTVMDLLPASAGPVFPVGRLDYGSEGLLLLTNDGSLAHRLMHPSFHLEKVYRIWVRGRVSQQNILSLKQGVMLDDGLARPTAVRVVNTKADVTQLEMRLQEGRKRQIRRMLSTLQLTIIRLRRTAQGPLQLAGLKPGQCRTLNQHEVRTLYQAVQLC